MREDCMDCGRFGHGYMVWASARLTPDDVCCMACLVKRLGRHLRLEDLTRVPINHVALAAATAFDQFYVGTEAFSTYSMTIAEAVEHVRVDDGANECAEDPREHGDVGEEPDNDSVVQMLSESLPPHALARLAVTGRIMVREMRRAESDRIAAAFREGFSAGANVGRISSGDAPLSAEAETVRQYLVSIGLGMKPPESGG